MDLPNNMKRCAIGSCLHSCIRFSLPLFNILLPEQLFSYLWGQHTLLSAADFLWICALLHNAIPKVWHACHACQVAEQYQPHVKIFSRHKILLSFQSKSQSTQTLWGNPCLTPANRDLCHTNPCSSVGPFHRVQSFRNRLLQHGFTMVFSRNNKGISPLMLGAHHSPPSSLTLVSAGLFLSHILTSLAAIAVSQ